MVTQEPAATRSTEPWLIVGLGNPGAEYARTRHNVGAEVVELLSERSDTRLRASKDNARSGDARIVGQRVTLAVPTTYMNESGQAVGALLRRTGVALDHLVVIHDELDLEPGVVRVKEGGGLAGHNGLRSITAHVHSQDYLRVRLGVGKPPGGKERGANHVLRGFAKSERPMIDEALERAADAVELLLQFGLHRAMTETNGSSPAS